MNLPLCIAGPDGTGPCRSPEACGRLRHCVAPIYRKLPDHLVRSLKTDEELETYVLGRIAEALAAATAAQPVELPPLPKEAAGYMEGCNVELKRGTLLFTAEQMQSYARAALAAATAAQPQSERAAFEAWAAKRAYDTTPNVTWPDLYAENRTQAVWEAWRDRAAAAQPIKLPEAKHFYYSPDDPRAVRKPLPLYTREQVEELLAAATAAQPAQPTTDYRAMWIEAEQRAVRLADALNGAILVKPEQVQQWLDKAIESATKYEAAAFRKGVEAALRHVRDGAIAPAAGATAALKERTPDAPSDPCTPRPDSA